MTVSGTVVAFGDNANLLDSFRGAESAVIGPGGLTLDTGNNTVYTTGLDARNAEGPILKTGTGTLVFDELPNTGCSFCDRAFARGGELLWGACAQRHVRQKEYATLKPYMLRGVQALAPSSISCRTMK